MDGTLNNLMLLMCYYQKVLQILLSICEPFLVITITSNKMLSLLNQQHLNAPFYILNTSFANVTAIHDATKCSMMSYSHTDPLPYKEVGDMHNFILQ